MLIVIHPGMGAELMPEPSDGINDIMPSYTAKPDDLPNSLALVLFDRTKLLDVTGPLQVFNDARYPDGAKAYDIQLISSAGGPVTTDAGVALQTISFEEAGRRRFDTVLVSGGDSALEAAGDPAIQAFLKQSAVTSRRIGSICLGAFILAAGGFLNGRKATTHWEGCSSLAACYPQIDVRANAIYVEDRGVWTSAGVTAGIDMALALVEEDLGRAEALRLARTLVLPVRRSGGQSQFSSALTAQLKSGGGRFDRLVSIILTDLRQNLSVPVLASLASMSERNFSRAFTAHFGTSPARFVEQLRVEHACEILQRGDASLSELPGLAGFSNAEQMRRAFHRAKGVSPSDYSARFGPVSASELG